MIRPLLSRCLQSIPAALVCLALAACAGAPVQEMSDARQALRAAQEAGAERVAQQEVNEARAYLTRAESNLQTRSYGEARRNAIAARTKAVEALEATRTAARP